MPHLLLVSIQVMNQLMSLFDLKKELIDLKKEPILCNHCKRTASNGVRCLGMCVADNDY